MTQKPTPKSNNPKSKRSSAVAVVVQTSPCVSSFPIVSDKKQDITTASAEGLFVSPAPRRQRRPHVRREYTVTTKGKLTNEQVLNFINTVNMFSPTEPDVLVAPDPSSPLVAVAGDGGGRVVGEQGKRSKSKRS
jgi:hypothetical protein